MIIRGEWMLPADRAVGNDMPPRLPLVPAADMVDDLLHADAAEAAVAIAAICDAPANEIHEYLANMALEDEDAVQPGSDPGSTDSKAS